MRSLLNVSCGCSQVTHICSALGPVLEHAYPPCLSLVLFPAVRTCGSQPAQQWGGGGVITPLSQDPPTPVSLPTHPPLSKIYIKKYTAKFNLLIQ